MGCTSTEDQGAEKKEKESPVRDKKLDPQPSAEVGASFLTDGRQGTPQRGQPVQRSRRR